MVGVAARKGEGAAMLGIEIKMGLELLAHPAAVFLGLKVFGVVDGQLLLERLGQGG